MSWAVKLHNFNSLSSLQRQEILKRPLRWGAEIQSMVANIIDQVRHGGDEAVRELSLKYDGVHVRSLWQELPSKEKAKSILGPELLEAFTKARRAIHGFHHLQSRPNLSSEQGGGEVRCYRRVQGLSRVGFYVPGGEAPLISSAMMMALPAQIAGCQEMSMCTPPLKSFGGVSEVMLAVAALLEINEVYAIGGAQAIAAMSLGTESLSRVDKIFGPGNAWVNEAKLQVASSGLCAIDLPAGPSEVMVVADGGARAPWVAADLLAQAEHGEDAHVVCVVYDRDGIEDIHEAILRQLSVLPRRRVMEKALSHSVFIKVPDLAAAMEVVNEYAPEHLILQITDPSKASSMLVNAGSVFMGYHTPETLGDYSSGTNHVLPTAGCARFYSGLSVESFQKTITFQERCSELSGDDLARAAITLARAEGLEAHAQAMEIRLRGDQAPPEGYDDDRRGGL